MPVGHLLHVFVVELSVQVLAHAEHLVALGGREHHGGLVEAGVAVQRLVQGKRAADLPQDDGLVRHAADADQSVGADLGGDVAVRDASRRGVHFDDGRGGHRRGSLVVRAGRDERPHAVRDGVAAECHPHPEAVGAPRLNLDHGVA